MKAILALAATLLMTTAFGAPGNGKAKGHQTGNTPANVSNAPVGTPHASVDRDLGRDRAVDVGKGRKKGLKKTHRTVVRSNRS
jgi:hypothetical protein